MKFTETKLSGAFVIDLEKRQDERGFFARAWCRNDFAAQGLETRLVQSNLCFNRHRGTLRGMHFQKAPYEEVKLVRCLRGAIYDVIIDLRPDSPTYTQWVGVELSPQNCRMLCVPRGFAHGFQSLVDDVDYHVSEFYTPGAEGGYRWNDPYFQITWPEVPQRVISEKDQAWPDFAPARERETRKP